MFLRNYWYVAGYDHEVSRRPLGRVILGEPIALYRLEDGTPVALEDRCAHRHLPLSMGRLIGDTLQCHYHGLRYDRSGACVRVPGQDLIPRSARVKSYPVVERYHWLWIWMGDPALADPASIPDYHWFDDPNWGVKGEYLHVKSNWQLIVDNLLDLTHLAFVHETTIGNSALVDQATVKVTAVAGQRDGHALDHRCAGAAHLRESRQVHRQCGPLADHQFRAARVSFASMSAPRRPAPARRRAAVPAASACGIERHHAGNGRDQPLFLGPGARFRHRQPAHHRHDHAQNPHRLSRRRGGVRGAAAQPGNDSRPAAD